MLQATDMKITSGSLTALKPQVYVGMNPDVMTSN